jgi:hypothetical protein
LRDRVRFDVRTGLLPSKKKDHAMRIKTFNDLISSLRGAAFRKVTCDGRCWYVREIATLQTLHRKGRQPASTAHAIERVRTGKP